MLCSRTVSNSSCALHISLLIFLMMRLERSNLYKDNVPVLTKTSNNPYGNKLHLKVLTLLD